MKMKTAIMQIYHPIFLGFNETGTFETIDLCGTDF